jgi:hypothetical protein
LYFRSHKKWAHQDFHLVVTEEDAVVVDAGFLHAEVGDVEAVAVEVEVDSHHVAVLVVVGAVEEVDAEVLVVVEDPVVGAGVEWEVVRKLLLSPIVMRACLSPEVRKMLCVPRIW